ncbi:phage tail protein [Lysobacter enzymogenes]|uniref:phage tail protein n=1 Tax=Lysobacter enzymogenes TaxID=69 RepID=UPI000895E29E|nr:phage tail protein [Lysobacter enzymogenes]SDW95339.1 Putative phage tail protein [Lysobacter enzymogenes]
MSGSTVGGIAGGIIGAFFGAPQLGFMIGSIIGGYVDPDKVYGPRLTDAQTQTSTVGIPIPFGYGTFANKGNIIWSSDLRERRKKSGGKGGPQTITYQYLRDYAIGICEGPIKAIKTIKRNGKVVYEVSANAAGEYTGDPSTLLSQSAKFLRKCTIYKGDEAQMPDPTIESSVGAGNVSPFRGLAYIVVKDDDLTDFRGAVPQYEFTVVMAGDLDDEVVQVIAPGRLSEFVDRDWPLGDDVTQYTYTHYSYLHSSGVDCNSLEEALDLFRSDSRNPIYLGYSFTSPAGFFIGLGLDVSPTGVSNFNSQPSVVNSESLVLVYNDFQADNFSNGVIGFSWCPTTSLTKSAQNRQGIYAKQMLSSPGLPWVLSETCTYGVYALFPLFVRVRRKRIAPRSPPDNGVLIPDAPGYYVLPDGTVEPVRTYTEEAGTFKVIATPSVTDGQYTRFETGPIVESTDPNYNNAAFWTNAYAAAVVAGAVPAGWTYNVDYPAFVPSAFAGVAEPVETIDRHRVPLSEVVSDLCLRCGLGSAQIDVAQLTDLLDGYVVATVGGADAFITPLSQAYFFDPAEWDAKLRFVKRGGGAVFALNADDLVERDGPTIEQERIQEAELLRKVTVSYVDPAAGFAPSTQAAERTVVTVEAKGESGVEIPVAMTSDDAARLAEKRMKVAWGETEKFELSLPYRFSYLTPTDVGFLTDKKGKVHRVRIMEDQEDSGIKLEQLAKDSQSAYGSNAVGVSPKPPVLTAPGLIGPTTFEPINGPVMRDQDDALGLYLAARGSLAGWAGCSILMSTDGGATSTVVAEIVDPAVIGHTMTSLAATVPNYRAEQTLTVYLPEAPASVDYLQLLQFQNRAFLGDEVIQYETVTALGDNLYRLGGLLRGKYGTAPAAHAAGARFVLFDESVVFVQAQTWLLGQTILFKAVSNGTSADAYTWQPFTFSPGRSQTEWAPRGVRAQISGSDIAVDWVGRRRLGSTRRSVHSQHFRGYRVTYTNSGGVIATHDVLTLSDKLVGGVAMTRPITITVSGLNAITGAGPASEAISI